MQKSKEKKAFIIFVLLNLIAILIFFYSTIERVEIIKTYSGWYCIVVHGGEFDGGSGCFDPSGMDEKAMIEEAKRTLGQMKDRIRADREKAKVKSEQIQKINESL